MSAILMQNLGGILVENTSIRILYFAMAGLMMLGMILTLFLRVQNTEKVFSVKNFPAASRNFRREAAGNF